MVISDGNTIPGRLVGCTLPQGFDSLEAFHAAGFVLESERQPLSLMQPWKAEMERRGISPIELARMINTSRTTVYNILKDETAEPKLSIAILICEALGMPFEKAFRLEGRGIYYLCKRRKTSKSVEKPVYLDTQSLHVLPYTEWVRQPDKDLWVIPSSGQPASPNTDGARPRYEKIYYMIPRKGGGASTE